MKTIELKIPIGKRNKKVIVECYQQFHDGGWFLEGTNWDQFLYTMSENRTISMWLDRNIEIVMEKLSNVTDTTNP